MKLEHYNTRRDLLECFENFINYGQKEGNWTLDIGRFLEEYSYIIRWDKSFHIGIIFYDEDEIFIVSQVIKTIFDLRDEVDPFGYSDNEEIFYTHPVWPRIVSLSSIAYKVLKFNSRKYAFKNLKEFLKNYSSLKLKISIESLTQYACYDSNEKLIMWTTSELFNDIYASLDFNLEGFENHLEWPSLIKLVQEMVTLFESNNAKYGFIKTLEEIDQEIAEQKQIEQRAQYFESRKPISELVWKKFMNWHRYRRKRPSFNKT